MAHNFFISYDLMAPGQHYDRVTETIKSTGDWARVEYSFFYVKSEMSMRAIADLVWGAMTQNDKLIVIDTTINDFYSFNLAPDVLAQMQSRWNR